MTRLQRRELKAYLKQHGLEGYKFETLQGNKGLILWITYRGSTDFIWTMHELLTVSAIKRHSSKACAIFFRESLGDKEAPYFPSYRAFLEHRHLERLTLKLAGL
jgi:hypothetical protein